MPAAAEAAAGGGKSRVTRFAKSTAASVTPVPPGKTHALSALDRAMERHTVHLVFYYRPGAVDRDRLKESLSEVLSYYPAMTGRLTRPEEEEGGGSRGWVVKCNDAGVRMMDARAAATLDEWLATASGEEEMDLVYWEPMSAEPFIWSPYYIQLTEFSDKSYAVGLSCTHMHADLTCAALFFHAWAAAHRRAPFPYPPFLHSPAFAVAATPRSPPPPCPLLSLKSSTAAAATATAMSSATFHFPAAAMGGLLASLPTGTTPFAALAALFWLRIAAAGDDAEGGKRELTVALDFRKRMRAPLPSGYYGNAVHFTRARADHAAGLAGVAAALDRHVAGVPEEELWAAVEWLHARQADGGEAFQMYGPELTCVALDHVPVYGAEFEAGAGPARVACRVGGADGRGLVVVMQAAGGEAARNVAVTLPAVAAAKLCLDDGVLRYGAAVAFGPKGETGPRSQ